jgi:hypothetical protein
MGKKIFNTEYAPIEEIEGVKNALESAGVPYYEIRNSKLWLGGGSLCVTNSRDYDRAREVIDTFQKGWCDHAGSGPVEHRVNWVLVVPLLVLFGIFVAVTIQSIVR